MSTCVCGGRGRGRRRGEECKGKKWSNLASLFLHMLLFKLAVRSSRIARRYLSTCRDNEATFNVETGSVQVPSH